MLIHSETFSRICTENKKVIEIEESKKASTLLTRKIIAIVGGAFAFLIIGCIISNTGRHDGNSEGKIMLLALSLITTIFTILVHFIPDKMYYLITRRKGIVRLIAGQTEAYDEDLDANNLNLYMILYFILAVILFLIALSI